MQKQLTLPSTIATKSQLMTLRLNVEEVLDSYTQNNIRQNEEVDVKPAPQISGLLTSLLATNKLKPSIEVINEIKKWVEFLIHHAPIVRITLSNEPGPKELAMLIDWFRRESGMIVLLQVGIQPTIAAGVIVRTPSHRYDFTLRDHLLGSTTKFIDAVNKVEARLSV